MPRYFIFQRPYFDDDAWPTPSPKLPDEPDASLMTLFFEEIDKGRLDVSDVIDPLV